MQIKVVPFPEFEIVDSPQLIWQSHWEEGPIITSQNEIIFEITGEWVIYENINKRGITKGSKNTIIGI